MQLLVTDLLNSCHRNEPECTNLTARINCTFKHHITNQTETLISAQSAVEINPAMLVYIPYMMLNMNFYTKPIDLCSMVYLTLCCLHGSLPCTLFIKALSIDALHCYELHLEVTSHTDKKGMLQHKQQQHLCPIGKATRKK